MTRESVRPPAVVRPASTDDADAITAVFLASRAAAMPYLTRLHDDDETRWWLTHVVMPECQVWVAQELDAPQLLGFVAVKDDVLEHLYLSPEHRRRGIGSQFARAGLPGEPGPADPAGLHAKHRRARLLRAARLPAPGRERRQPQRRERAGHDLRLDAVPLTGQTGGRTCPSRWWMGHQKGWRDRRPSALGTASEGDLLSILSIPREMNQHDVSAREAEGSGTGLAHTQQTLASNPCAENCSHGPPVIPRDSEYRPRKNAQGEPFSVTN